MLYSYCVRYDDGAAPNPYYATCTLAICKPAIRRVAQPGDWVVGLGSSQSPVGDISGHVVYAMRVTRVLSLRDYDAFCRRRLRGKIPKWDSADFRRRVGDCIYDFSRSGEPRLRSGVHDERNRTVDLGGENALLSKHFYYFGDKPIALPSRLAAIIHQTQGHKSRSNQPYVKRFVAWIDELPLRPNRLYGEPQIRIEASLDSDVLSKCGSRHLEADCADEY